MANSSFFKNTGTSSQIQSSIGASSVTATNAAAAASTSAAAASASSSSASTSASSSSTASSNAQDWAVKTTGLVDSTDYASKAWAIGGLGVTNSSGASKEWATHLGSTVDGSEYSSKHYAQEVATDAAQVATDAAQVASDRIQTGQDATNTAASQVAAAASAAAAAATLSSFDDRYYGAHASDSAAQTYITGESLTVDTGDLYFNTTDDLMKVYDGSAWIAASSAGSASLINYNYTATAAQTAFSGVDDNSNTLSYTVSNLIVTRNGVVLEDGTDYTATNGTSVVLAVAATAGDEINVVAFESFTTADMVSATNGGTFQNNVTVNGTMTATAFSGDGSALTNLPAAGISDVVQDTTPQLGGNLDTNGNNINFGDNDKAVFGADSDLEISHNGNENVIDSNSGTLVLRSAGAGTIELRDQGSQVLAQFNDNSDVKLYYNNNEKLATTSTGVDVTGTVTADDLDLSVGTAGDGIQVTSTGANYLNLGFDTNRTGASQTLTQIEQKWNGTAVARIAFVTGSDTTNKDDAEIRFQTASAGTPSTAMVISSAGAVGIGTASPTAGFRASIKGDYSSIIGGIEFDSGGGDKFTIGHASATSPSGILNVVQPANMIFKTNNTDRMRLTSAGKLCIGTQVAVSTSMLNIVPADINRIVNTKSYDANTQYHFVFQNHLGGNVGKIQVSTSATAFVVNSDYRLKTDVTYDWDATTRLKQLKPARFAWIIDGDDAVPVDGFIAHEVQDIVPESISGTKDAMMDEEYEVTPAVLDDDGNEVTQAVMGTRSVPDYQGIDQSKLTPLLTKALIEAVEKIEQLEARITALETN